jgi:hypothetical protein
MEKICSAIRIAEHEREPVPTTLDAAWAKTHRLSPRTLEDGWERPITYTLFSKDGTSYMKLHSAGQDGLVGTGDDISLQWNEKTSEWKQPWRYDERGRYK